MEIPTENSRDLAECEPTCPCFYGNAIFKPDSFRSCCCLFCGLDFSVGYKVKPNRISMYLLCVECGTMHRVENNSWIISRTGPHIQPVDEQKRFYYLKDVVESPGFLSRYWGAEEAEIGKAEARKSAGPELERERIEYQLSRQKLFAERAPVEIRDIRISLIPSRRERWKRWLKSSAGLRLQGIVLLPLYAIAALFFALIGGWEALGSAWGKLPHNRRRYEQKRAVEVAGWRLDHRRRWHKVWAAIPLESLEPREFLKPQDLPDEEDMRRWLSGVLCGQCGAAGSLRFDWDSITCPLCKKAPLQDDASVPSGILDSRFGSGLIVV